MRAVRSEPSDVTAEDDFARFFESERTSAMRLAWLLTRDERTAEDVVQEAFTAVYPRFDNLHQPAAYLRRAVVNAVFERSRRAGREHRRIALVHAGERDHVEGPTGGLADAIAALPIKQRTAIVLRYWGDLDIAEIARAIDVRPGTVRSLLSRGTARLRKDLPT